MIILTQPSFDYFQQSSNETFRENAKLWLEKRRNWRIAGRQQLHARTTSIGSQSNCTRQAAPPPIRSWPPTADSCQYHRVNTSQLTNSHQVEWELTGMLLPINFTTRRMFQNSFKDVVDLNLWSLTQRTRHNYWVIWLLEPSKNKKKSPERYSSWETHQYCIWVHQFCP